MTMESGAETLLSQSEKMFQDVLPLRQLQQELAENFYAESAEFTQNLYMGEDWASYLTTSYPLSVRRDLSNIFSTMLRPQDKIWARATVRHYDDLDEEGKRWLEWASLLKRNAFYDMDSEFERATAQADDFVATFGQAVISCEMNWRKRALLFRTWHLKDCVWRETYDGKVGRIDRRWKPTAFDLNQIFQGNVHEKVKKCLSKEPYKEIEVRHMFIPIEEYDNGKGWEKNPAYKYVSIFYDVENKFIMEEVPYKHEYYVVPRWKKIPGSQYAYSPSAMASLPNARLIQDMMLTVLEAGQKAVDPPMLAYEDVLRSDTNLFAGGITTVDAEYDERLGKPLQPVFDSRSTNMSLGVDLMQMVQAETRDLWYLNKIGLPDMGSGMSELEISQRVADYVRDALPLFAPLEPEYNGQICSLGFDVLLHNGGFGPPESIPESLLGSEISFKFENPLRETVERSKSMMLSQSAAVMNQMAAFDPSVIRIMDTHGATRDTIDGIGAPREWFKTEEQVQAEVEAENQQTELAQTMATLDQGAQTAKTMAEASSEFAKAETGE